MQNRDKTIALTLLALLVYAFFVWHGMNFNGASVIPLNGLLASVPTVPEPSRKTTAVVQQKATSDETSYKRSQDGWYQFSKIKWDITGYGLYKEDGKRYLVYEFTWVNTSDGPIDFMDGDVCINAYQDGIQCEYGVVMGVDTKAMTKIMPGKKLVSYHVIELRNTKSKVLTYVSEYFVDKDPVVFNVDLAYISKNAE